MASIVLPKLGELVVPMFEAPYELPANASFAGANLDRWGYDPQVGYSLYYTDVTQYGYGGKPATFQMTRLETSIVCLYPLTSQYIGSGFGNGQKYAPGTHSYTPAVANSPAQSSGMVMNVVTEFRDQPYSGTVDWMLADFYPPVPPGLDGPLPGQPLIPAAGSFALPPLHVQQVNISSGQPYPIPIANGAFPCALSRYIKNVGQQTVNDLMGQGYELPSVIYRGHPQGGGNYNVVSTPLGLTAVGATSFLAGFDDPSEPFNTCHEWFFELPANWYFYNSGDVFFHDNMTNGIPEFADPYLFSSPTAYLSNWTVSGLDGTQTSITLADADDQALIMADPNTSKCWAGFTMSNPSQTANRTLLIKSDFSGYYGMTLAPQTEAAQRIISGDGEYTLKIDRNGVVFVISQDSQINLKVFTSFSLDLAFSPGVLGFSPITLSCFNPCIPARY